MNLVEKRFDQFFLNCLVVTHRFVEIKRFSRLRLNISFRFDSIRFDFIRSMSLKVRTRKFSFPSGSIDFRLSRNIEEFAWQNDRTNFFLIGRSFPWQSGAVWFIERADFPFCFRVRVKRGRFVSSRTAEKEFRFWLMAVKSDLAAGAKKRQILIE